MGRTGSKKKKNKKQLVVNRGRVRRVTFGTGAKVVESAGVVRVKVSYKNDPTGNWSVTVKYILAD